MKTPKLPKLTYWHLGTVALLAALWAIAPQQIGVLALKGIYITLALALGYYADRTIFSAYRPYMLKHSDLLLATGMIRRAIVIAAVVLGFALGL